MVGNKLGLLIRKPHVFEKLRNTMHGVKDTEHFINQALDHRTAPAGSRETCFSRTVSDDFIQFFSLGLGQL